MARPEEMPARVQERGCKLIEPLVVMIMIGSLAGIAIPTILRQRALAHHTSTKADVANLGKRVATYLRRWDGRAGLGPAVAHGRILLIEGNRTSPVNLTNRGLGAGTC